MPPHNERDKRDVIRAVRRIAPRETLLSAQKTPANKNTLPTNNIALLYRAKSPNFPKFQALSGDFHA